MVIRTPFSSQPIVAQTTSFRGAHPVTSAARPPWREDIARIGASFTRIQDAASRLRAQYPNSTISVDLGELQRKLEKAERKISAGPLGGLVGNGPIARCFAHRRRAAEKTERILHILAQAANTLANDLDAMARGGGTGAAPDEAALAALRDAQRKLIRRLDDARGDVPKEYTRFRLRAAVIVGSALISAIGTILGATVAAPILVIPLTVAVIGLAIQTTLHFTQRRDTGWKALTQLIDQFAASSQDLNYDALLDVTRRLTGGIDTLRAEHRAARDDLLARLAALDLADRERAAMMRDNARVATRNETRLLALQQAVEGLARDMTTVHARLEGPEGVQGMIEQLRVQLAVRLTAEDAPDAQGQAMPLAAHRVDRRHAPHPTVSPSPTAAPIPTVPASPPSPARP